jgi:hypothetical protein
MTEDTKAEVTWFVIALAIVLAVLAAAPPAVYYFGLWLKYWFSPS